MLIVCISIFLIALATLAFATYQLFKIRRAQREVLFLHLLRYQHKDENAPWVSTAPLYDDLEGFMCIAQLYLLLDELEKHGWVETEFREINRRTRRFARVIKVPA
jgi:hypothetical protein